MIKAIFFDIDGTLVSFDTHIILDSTIKAIEKARQKGILIFISTGRAKMTIDNLAPLQAKNLIDGYITLNGSYCYVGDNVLYHSYICDEDIKLMLDYCKTYKKSCIFISDDKRIIFQPEESLEHVYYNKFKIPEITEATSAEILGEKIIQMTPFVTSHEEKEIFNRLLNCEMGRWHPSFTDVTAKGITKKKGMVEIIKHFNIKAEETMSFGDGENDISILKSSGIGVAMGQSSDNVKNSADYITDSVDKDGIFNAMEHFGVI